MLEPQVPKDRKVFKASKETRVILVFRDLKDPKASKVLLG
jgi:hypothetical protein